LIDGARRGEFGARLAEANEHRQIAEIAVARLHGQRIDQPRRVTHAFRCALQ
jgi:hypothetical protein